MRRFTDLLGLATNTGRDDDEDWVGIWDGARFVFKTLRPPPPGSSWLRRVLANSLRPLKRYAFPLLRMDSLVQVHSLLLIFYCYTTSSLGPSVLYQTLQLYKFS